jgi:hypothetical protein
MITSNENQSAERSAVSLLLLDRRGSELAAL